jgi:DNA-binding NarL/FixJ family response regulator
MEQMAVVVEVHDRLLAADVRRVLGRMPGVSVVVKENSPGRSGPGTPLAKGETLRRIIVGEPAAHLGRAKDESPTVVDMLQQGIWAVVPSETGSIERTLKEYVVQVGSGLCPLLSSAVSDPNGVEKIVSAMRARPAPRVQRGAKRSPLSDGETDILQRIANGDKNREIAHELGFELQTVKNKVTIVLTKTQARSRTHAVAVALANGWISQ